MITLEVNPADRRAILHEQLTRCFPSWGGPAATRWYLDREVDGEAPDVVTLNQDGRCVAGILIHYRTLEEQPNGSQRRLCGILGSTWTIPEMRGQRLYSRLVREVDAVARRRGATRLLSFSRRDNHSGATLVRAGARERAAEYWCFDPAPGEEPEAERGDWVEVERNAAVETELWTARERASAGRARLRYLSCESFCSQYLDRPAPVRILRHHAEEAWALVEDGGDVDRLLLLAPSHCDSETDPRVRAPRDGGAEERLLEGLRARSHARGRPLFCFRAPRAPSLPGLAARARRTPCRFTIKAIVGPDADSPVAWNLHNGDRM